MIGLRVLVVASILAVSSHAENRRIGEIALSDAPACSFFVIATARGFVFAWWRDGFHLFLEGDGVYGAEERPGPTIIILDAHPALGEVPTQISVDIERVEPLLIVAQETFHRRCPSS